MHKFFQIASVTEKVWSVFIGSVWQMYIFGKAKYYAMGTLHIHMYLRDYLGSILNSFEADSIRIWGPCK